jgi:isoleucyl-tRNA synthetase
VVTKDLADEGVARDAVRHIQQARKDAGLEVSDRITLHLLADSETAKALSQHQDFIARETLAEELEINTGSPATELAVGDGGSIEIELAKK